VTLVVAAAPEHEAGLLALFEATGSPCYCRFWHFDDTNNAWLARCADAPEQNRAELTAALRNGSVEARGVVALDDGEVVGWCKVAPADSVPKLYARRLYKSLPCLSGDRSGVYVVGCSLVHQRYRHRGVATALVEGAVRLATAAGARVLEAFPRRPTEPVADEELWTGPMSAFTKNGFVVVNDFQPYPVLRREITCPG
jgi:GNAT superfamily N-acetyltransferase